MNKLITRVLKTRKDLVQVGLMAVIVAVGTNLLAAWLDRYMGSQNWLILATAALMVCLGFLYLTEALLREGKFEHTYRGLLLLDRTHKSVVSVEAYPLLEKLAKYTRAVFLENEAWKRSWETNMFPTKHTSQKGEGSSLAKDDRDRTPKKEKDAVRYVAITRMDESEMVPPPECPLLIEAVEFCLLEFLSLHLSSYFDARDNDGAKIAELDRTHIPQVLLENRILSLLSTPIEDRPIFNKLGIDRSKLKGELHMVSGSNGATYEKFLLILPVGTTVSRPAPGVIHLNHNRYELKLEIIYRGFGHSLPRYFRDYYVTAEPIEIDGQLILVRASAQLKRRAFLSIFDWEYYEWIDSFFQRLEEAICFKSFINRIDWNSTATRIRATRIERAAALRRGEIQNSKATEKPGEKAKGLTREPGKN